MNPLQMVDLKGQYQRLKPEIDAAMQAVVESTAFINGPQVQSFANSLADYLNVLHVVPCANGTDALQIALMALDLPAGEEVIVPAFNYVATAEVIALLGLKPVFVDVLPDSMCLDPAKVRAAITDKTVAIMPVHLFGQCAPMEELMDLAIAQELYVIEDNAQAIGAQYIDAEGGTSFAGTLGHIGTTSFFPSKNLGCMGDGGAIFTQDEELAAVIKQIANHGQQKKYHYSRVGVNSRLDTLQAALLEVKLQHLNDFILRRQKAAATYDSYFNEVEGLSIPSRAPYSSHVFHQYTLQVIPEKRDALKDYLQQAGVPSMIYYPAPLHLHEAYAYLGYKEGDFPVSELLCKCVISLPMHTELTELQQAFIAEKVLRFFQQ
ncbi:aminotransferase class I/II-fold pyridoxal phosphate-dependent enzyme [Nibribacter ruber]|uniref:Aminotransferase class I/II-fold pyridoxal phosphate-dependent enzyme n=1 Tax=Nibribacter ruber TaxID=2698458 RepID=A0A6P1NSW4_9BACT|nr:DegT/DnrJ/EryC1/StrS family aminotransferase [Nibribacter ruber]QHL86120.1 aminotransferase class I/II-fold pyridoxal phosphate-dependent enzyme [Nibribacter ruber]